MVFLLSTAILMLSKFQQTYLQLAKASILEEFGLGDPKTIKLDDPLFNEKRACFVTLKIDDQLRGCIGSIMPYRKLYEDIINNARNAAFEDPRFPPLNAKEIKENLNIGITILSPIQDKTFISQSDLFDFLDKEKCGLILKLGYRQATFLPSVRKEISDSHEFVTHLLYKAGISLTEFQHNFKNIEFQIYYGEEFSSDRDKIK